MIQKGQTRNKRIFEDRDYSRSGSATVMAPRALPAGIQRSCRLKQQDRYLFGRHRPMLDSAWHDEELARFEPLLVIAEVHSETALDDEEHLVFVVMVVPDKFAVKFD
jgi:hypothetical protein